MTRPIETVRILRELERKIAAWRSSGDTIALVPTMGALHAGHLKLVARARRKACRTVVSIFVNPTQFAPGEDLTRYPRDEAGDLAKLTEAGADLVWAPAPATMYPAGFATRIVPGGAALGLEGEFRPEHFSGVATVCAKLFAQVRPDVAVFGEKDFQQLAVIRQLVRDLDLGLSILGVPTVREKDGLALSSRNGYLSSDERRVAPALHTALRSVADAARTSQRKVAIAIAAAERGLLASGFRRVDYLALRDAETLGPFEPLSGRPGRVLGAAHLGTTRLIDNVPV